MFSKISRYRKLPDEVTVDVSGRRLEAKSLRLLPDVSGTFLHTIEDVDRLDHLAYKYYKQPRKWWRICDANPEFMSPQALLGKAPMVTQRFELSFINAGGEPHWAELLSEIAAVVGVEDVWLADDERTTRHLVWSSINPGREARIKELLRKIAAMDGVEQIGLAADKKSVRITYSSIYTPIDALNAAIKAVEFIVEQPRMIVNSIITTYNQLTIQVDALINAIRQASATVGFSSLDIGHPQTIGRVGKQIVIPPDVVG